MRADPVAWKDYQDVIALWDTLAGDGLENEEPYYTPEEEAELVATDPIRPSTPMKGEVWASLSKILRCETGTA